MRSGEVMAAERGQQGFTLLELMVVIAMISILTAMALPRLSGSLFADELKSVSRKLVGMIAEAGQEAVRNQSEYLLDIDMELNLVQLTSAADEEAREQGESAEVPAKLKLTLPESVRIVEVASVAAGSRTTGKTELHFTRKGYVDKTYIYLHADDGREMTVMVSPFLGVIKLADSHVDL